MKRGSEVGMAPNPSESTTTPVPSLTGLLKCEHCGIPMLAKGIGAEETAIQYMCPATAGKHPTGCPTPPIVSRDLDLRILERLTQHLLGEELIPDLIAAVKEDAARRIKQDAAELGRQQGALKRLSAAKEELVRKVEEGYFPYQEVKHLIEPAGVAGERLEAGAKAIIDRLSAHERATTDDAWIIERARDTGAHLDRTTATARIRFIQLLVNEITVNSGAITVSYNMPVFSEDGRLPQDKEEISL